MTSPDTQPQVSVLTRACASTRIILENVRVEQLALPTPCSDWQVHDLIDHILNSTDFFVDLAERGASPDDRPWPTYTDDFVPAFDELVRRLVAGFSEPGAMARIMQLPTGPAPGSQCIQVAVGEIFVHGWDLATATGQEMPPDHGVVEAVLASDWPSMCADVRNAHPWIFAPEVPVPADASAMDRLVGFLGRDPNWIGDS